MLNYFINWDKKNNKNPDINWKILRLYLDGYNLQGMQ
jgi:hypothetical protein